MSTKFSVNPDQKMSEQSIFENPQEILMNAPMGIYTSTGGGAFLSANPAMARMFGYDSPADLIESVTDIATQLYVDPADRVEFTRLMEEQGKVVNHECRMRCRDGSIIWVSKYAGEVRDKNGELIHYQNFVTDITGRKQAEDRLGESEEWFRTIVEGAPDAVFVQTEKRFAFLNTQALRLFGAEDESELLGQPVFDRFHPDFHDLVLERIHRLNEMRQPVADRLEQKYLRLDGSEVWVETTAQPIDYHGKKGALVF